METSLLSAFSQGVIAGEVNASLPACQPACIQNCPHSKKFIVLQAPAREETPSKLPPTDDWSDN